MGDRFAFVPDTLRSLRRSLFMIVSFFILFYLIQNLWLLPLWLERNNVVNSVLVFFPSTFHSNFGLLLKEMLNEDLDFEDTDIFYRVKSCIYDKFHSSRRQTRFHLSSPPLLKEENGETTVIFNISLSLSFSLSYVLVSHTLAALFRASISVRRASRSTGHESS